jgi:hypothetical protein
MGRHRQAEGTAEPEVPVHSALVHHLAEAQAELERARRPPEKQSRWQRKRTEAHLAAATRAVQAAAEAAHAAGATWTEIGDALGINRATPAPRAPHLGRLVVLHPEADADDSEAQAN